MAKPETWVQIYRAQRDPGPDGDPTRISDGQMYEVWVADRRTKRVDVGIEQPWRRVR